MKKTIVSTNRLMILAVMMVMTISARSAMPLDLRSLATIGTQERRSLWTQIRIPFCLYICLSKGHGEFSEMGVPFFLHIKNELCSLRAYAIIVSRNWKLVDKHVNFFLLQILGQLQFNGHQSLIIAQVPDTFLRPFGSKRQSRAHPVRHSPPS